MKDLARPPRSRLHAERRRSERMRSALIAGGVLIAGFALLLVGRPLGVPRTQEASNLIQIAAPAAAALAAWRARGGPRTTPPVRRGWTFLSLSGASWGVGQAIWTYYEVVLGQPVPTPSLADIGYLCSPILAMIGLVSFRRGPVEMAGRLRVAVDGVLIVLLLSAAAWLLTLRSVIDSANDDQLSLVATLAYPIADVALLSVLLLTSRRARRLGTATTALISAGFALLAAADLSYSHLSAVGGYETGGITDLGWVAGFVLLAIAAIAAMDDPRDLATPQSALDRATERESPWVVALPIGLAALVSGLSVADAVSGRRDLLTHGLMGLMVVLTLVRQVAMSAESRDLARRLAHDLAYDRLTGLPNRALLTDRIARALARCSHDEGPTTVLLINLDGFKTVNDSFGHDVGDLLLCAVGERLNAQARESDCVGRLGADNFVVVLEGVHSRDLEATMDRFAGSLDQSFELSGATVFTRACVGVVIAEPGAPGAHVLLRDADAAMHRAKQVGPGSSQTFETAVHESALRRMALETDLRQALESGGLSVAYQPVVDLASGRIVGAEALARWTHPQRGVVPPSEFIPIAEQTGLIVPLGRWVLREALLRARVWRELSGIRDFSIGVNVAARQLSRPAFVGEVERALREAAVSPDVLTLEITESDLMRDVDTAMSQLFQLKALGVGIAVDDFGTGYSSLAYLRRLPVDVLKIDRSFVDGVALEAEDASIVEAICGLGRALGLVVLAEGIEDTEQACALRNHGCDLGQGYLFASPQPRREFEALLAVQVTPGGISDA